MMLALVILYFLGLLCIFIYSLIQLDLAFKFLKSRKKKLPTKDFEGNYPIVTIQLPIYNEKYVAERLIRNIANFDYPKDKLEIQVLDDSTDETKELIEKIVQDLKLSGNPIELIHRTDRSGFKAGALKNGLEKAKGEFIAIFDADFLPSKDWLIKTIAHFHNDSIGMVQTRWTHLNSEHSAITKMQEFALDYHFTVEQNGRYFGQHFMNFNGTAGIWRKETILDAGNWKANTITEDLDLSYRAQLKGWKFKYVEDICSPAELPITLSAVKSQQYRWNKGAAENFGHVFKGIWNAKHSLITKMHASFHLLNSSLYIPILCVALLSIPIFIFRAELPNFKLFISISTIFLLSSLFFLYSFWIAYKARKKASFFHFLKDYLLFIFGTLGLSLHNTWAVIQGHLGVQTDFIRTPKFNSIGKDAIVSENSYLQGTIKTIGELIMAIGFASLIVLAVLQNNYTFIVLHTLMFIGFSMIVYQSIVERK